MKLNLALHLTAFAVTSAIGTNVFACGGGFGWVTPNANAPKIAFADAQNKAIQDLGVKVVEAGAQPMCGSDLDYIVTDIKSGQQLGVIPVPYESQKKNDGRFLWARASQLMQTPRKDLISLGSAQQRFYDDENGLEADLGVGAYVPNALPMEERTANHGQDYLIYVTINAQCGPGRSVQMPANVYDGLAIKTIEYIPGRTDYSPSTIYQTGDLRKAIFTNPKLFAELEKRVKTNTQFCSDDDDMNSFFEGPAFWKAVEKRMSQGINSVLATAVDQYRSTRGKPVSAYMLDANRIMVTFVTISGAASKNLFAGSVSDMVTIQNLLAKIGIKTDKSSHLDNEGQWTINDAKGNSNFLPDSLK